MKELESAQSLRELTRLVSNHLHCEGVLVTRVMETCQEIIAHSGLTLPSRFETSTPLSHSICQHTAAMDYPLVIDDTVSHPLLKENLAFAELGIASYLGAPVHTDEGVAVGALCAIDLRKRRWTEREKAIVCSAARIADRLLSDVQNGRGT